MWAMETVASEYLEPDDVPGLSKARVRVLFITEHVIPRAASGRRMEEGG